MLLKMGLALLILSFVTYLQAVKNQRAYHWVPATTPLILEKDKSIRLSFVADGDFEYNILLSFEKTIEFDDLNAALRRMDKDTIFAIQVEEDGKPLEAGGYSGIFYSSTISLIPASFSAHSGRRYSVTITPKESLPNLQVTKPQARIRIDSKAYKPYVIRMQLFGHLAALLFLVGLGLIGAGWWSSR